MGNNDISTYIKVENSIAKSISDGFKALNINLSDCAKSLRNLNGMFREDDYWHPISGEDGCKPGPEYDWVLVRIRDAGTSQKPYNAPHIAELRNGEWWAQEWDAPYGSEKVPFEVVYWKPIPGDEVVEIMSSVGKALDRGHIYGH